jgi:DNA-binding response OmpR family regulator
MTLSVKASVLIVEDEPLIAMATEEMVNELGYEVIGAVSSVDAAMSALLRRRPDIALLDVRLRSGTSLSIALWCRKLGIGVAFITGLPINRVPEDCGSFPVLSKPFTVADLRLTLEEAASSTSMLLN